MSILLRLANRLILANSRHAIDAEDRWRVAIPCGQDSIEAWVTSSHPQDSEQPADWFALKFPGAGGRAERGGPHPCDIVSPTSYEAWTINPPGYGTSTGDACVTSMAATCDAAWQAIHARANGRPILVTGNSLGGMYATYVAARYPVAGVLLRNPAPVHELIQGRYSWWNFGLAVRWIGNQIPATMITVANAKQCTAPALFVTSEKDRKIPPRFQHQVFDAWGGESTLFIIEDADHHTPIPEHQIEEYREAVARWAVQLK